MASGPTTEQGKGELLADDETMQLEWEGTLKQGEDETHAAFIATDRRLILSFGRGHFKDIGLQHIESVEVGTEIKTNSKGTDPDDLKVLGAVSAVIGVVSMFVGGFSGLATTVGIGLLVLGGAGYLHAKGNYDEMKDSVEVTERTIYHILMKTRATSPFSIPIYIETEDNVGPNLSRLVQESQPSS